MFFQLQQRTHHPEVFCAPVVEDTNFSQQTALDECSDTGTRWPPRAKKSSAVKRYGAKLLLSQLWSVPSSPCPDSSRHHPNSPNLSPQLQLCFWQKSSRGAFTISAFRARYKRKLTRAKLSHQAAPLCRTAKLTGDKRTSSPTSLIGYHYHI